MTNFTQIQFIDITNGKIVKTFPLTRENEKQATKFAMNWNHKNPYYAVSIKYA